MRTRKTKIVCTLGPATDSADGIAALLEAGMDVVRLNFSHGDRETHRQTIRRIRKIAQQAGREVGILQDLGGPKIRLGELPESGIELRAGSTVPLGVDGQTSEGVLPVSYQYLLEDVGVGERILLADGLVELEVREVTGDRLLCDVVIGGTLTSRKGVNLPQANLRIPAFTDKDRSDLEVGLEEGVDFVALSFVRHEDDVAPVRSRLSDLEHPPSSDRQDRETAGGGAPRSDPRSGGRRNGGTGRSRGRNAAGKGTHDPEADHRGLPSCRPAGDHRNPDVALDGRQPPSPASRGLGRRQCCPRRHRRGHVVRGDGDRPLPH